MTPAAKLPLSVRPTPRPKFSPAHASLPEQTPLFLAAILVVLAALFAYCNSFTGQLVEDDVFAISANPSIHHLWPPWDALSPPTGLTVGGRPLLNLTFALNYAVSGEDPWSYHVFNLAVHILAALTLLGVVRRTLLQPALRGRFGADALALAAAITVLWTVHPAQTDAVAYISQRSESLMGLCYLLTLYGFIRGVTSDRSPRPWFAAAVAACYAGMAFKEVMVTAPLAVFLYDRTFVAGTFREAWRRRGRLYVVMAAGWLIFAPTLLTLDQRSVGPELGVSPWDYLKIESLAIVHYLALIVWPHPLVLDRGNATATSLLAVLPEALAVLVLLGVTAWALARRPLLGFVGAWFFLILAPTSSFIPIVKSPIADHRLYLPLAALLALVVLGLYRLAGRRCFWAVGVLAVVWSTLTFARNEDYQTAAGLWGITVAQAPDNVRARNNYGGSLMLEGRYAEAMAQFETALKLDPKDTESRNNLGLCLVNLQRPELGIPYFVEAVRLNPTYTAAFNNWGNALLQMGRPAEAIDHFRAALKIDPTFNDARNGLAVALARTGHVDEAIRELEELLRRDPANPTARQNIAMLRAGER